MARNFRTRTFTKRTTKLTQKQIERLRATRLKNAKNYKQTKFFNSKQFDKQLRANVISNRTKANVERLDRIVKQLGGTKDYEKVIRATFGEKTTLRGGKKVRTNTFSSQKQTNRLKRVLSLTKKKKLNIKRYLRHNKTYQEVKQYLPEGATENEIIYVIARGKFYLENKPLIMKHNKNVQKYGHFDAQTKKAGIELRNRHYESQNNENQSFLDFFEKR